MNNGEKEYLNNSNKNSSSVINESGKSEVSLTETNVKKTTLTGDRYTIFKLAIQNTYVLALVAFSIAITGIGVWYYMKNKYEIQKENEEIVDVLA